MPKRPYPAFQRRHEAILQWVIANPAGTQKECAKATGYSPSQVSRIMCSPMFYEIYKRAMAEARLNAMLTRNRGLGTSQGVRG